MTSNDLPLIPAITSESGFYTHATEAGVDWRYTYRIHNRGMRSEMRFGRLEAEGIDLSGVKPLSCIATPWGVMQLAQTTLYSRGWLLEYPLGQPIFCKGHESVPVPPDALSRGGKWTATVGPWSYAEAAYALGSKSERRIGRLRYERAKVVGEKEGDYVDTPWGRMRWMGKIDENATTDYEQGFLLHGTYDRSLDEMEGNPIDPTTTLTATTLESLYLNPGAKLGGDREYHNVRLALDGRLGCDTEMDGRLVLDPNICSLNDFGDRTGCTKIAFKVIDVRVVRMRLGDPSGLGRSFFSVTGDDLPQGLALITYEHLERCYLKLEDQLLALFPDDHIP